MNPASPRSTAAPRWALSVLLASLGMLGPFAVDTYLPAFDGMARSLDASAVQMQQTLSAYLFGFAFMNLFHGALSDALGRRPVVMAGLVVFTLSSVGCALSTHVGPLVFFRAVQGMATGAGIVVSRAIIRDLYPPADAQRVMSQVTIVFGVAPAIAPIVGGWLYTLVGWHGIFVFLAAVGALLALANHRLLPESLPPPARRPFALGDLMRGYRQLCGSAPFLLLACASGVPFNGMFLYVLASPAFLGRHLGLAPTEFWWFFVATTACVMLGAAVSGRLAGRIPRRRQIRHGFVVMGVASVVNVVVNLAGGGPAAVMIAPVSLYAFGWSLMVPAVTLMALDLFPDRRGMASSLQAVIGSVANGLVAGVLVPWVMDSTLALALASAAMVGVGLAAWTVLRARWPHVVRA